jgi:hypothetical protein
MAVQTKVTRAVAAALTAGLVFTTIPAEAGGLRRGFLPGLIGGFALGGFALGALAASAQAAQQNETLYATLPDEAEEYVETGPVRRFSPAQQRARRLQAVAPRRAAVGLSSSTLDRCRDAIAAVSRRHGSVAVRVATAGAVERTAGGGISAPLNARIEYARRGKTQVRQARVACQINGAGQVVAFR